MKIFSASKLNTCLIEYYLSYVENIKIQKYSEALLLGNLLHKGLELYVIHKYLKENEDYLTFNNYIKNRNIENVIEYLNDNNRIKTIYKEVYESNGYIDENMTMKIEKIMSLNVDSVFNQYNSLFNKTVNYVESIINKNKYDSLIPEGFFKKHVNNVILYGIVDLAIINKDKTIIIDYKISKNEASKFQIYFYGYISFNESSNKNPVDLFYIYPKLNKITHVSVNYKTMSIIFEPFMINKINSIISIDKIIEPMKIDSDTAKKIGDYIINIKGEDIIENQRLISNNFGISRIIDNMNIISALISDARISKINNSKNTKCSYCDFKKICLARSIYPSMLS